MACGRSSHAHGLPGSPSTRPPRLEARRAACPRPARALRWIGLVVLLAVAVGYVQPLRAYRDATADVAAQQGARSTRIARTNATLEQRIEETETPEFVEREARKLGLVKPGERLFIVTGVDEWKHEPPGTSRDKARLR